MKKAKTAKTARKPAAPAAPSLDLNEMMNLRHAMVSLLDGLKVISGALDRNTDALNRMEAALDEHGAKLGPQPTEPKPAATNGEHEEHDDHEERRDTP